MTEEELQQVKKERFEMKALFRDDSEKQSFWPIIIKASQAGALETLLVETDKIIKNHF